MIEQTTQPILDTHAHYLDSSFATLYDETTIPLELYKARQNNDRTVMLVHGFSIQGMTDSRCVAELMRMYLGLAEQEHQ